MLVSGTDCNGVNVLLIVLFFFIDEDDFLFDFFFLLSWNEVRCCLADGSEVPVVVLAFFGLCLKLALLE